MFASKHALWRRLFFAAVLLLMFSAKSLAQDVQSFNLDEGDADFTLKQFAKQARLSIVYDPRSVAGVQTQEVIGMLLPSDALERMLEGTPLVFKEDLESGAFAVTRSEIPSLDQTTQNTEPQILEETEMNVKKNNWLKSLAVVLTLGIASGPGQVSAQSSDSGRITGRIQDAYTGKYMESAQVMIAETGQSALSDNFGEFRIGNVAAGTYTLEVTYTGYFDRVREITVSGGQTTNLQTIRLRSRGEFESDDEVYELGTFQVVPETDAYSIALQEQRAADLNKVVVNAGAFGDVTEGNIGEFIKFLPGISINYVAADVRSIDVRGMGSNFTPVTVDGNRMASAASTEPNRNFELEQVSINNVERIEVIRVPTADISADSLGGSVNLVSRSAFERDGRNISYRAYLSFNDEHIDFSKTPGWGPREQRKIWPGFDINYSDILADGKLGISLNYLNSKQFNPQHRSRYRWEFEEFNDEPDDGSAPLAVLRRYQFQDGPKFTHRESLSLKADYKISDDTVLSGSYQWNDYSSQFRNRNIQWDTNMDERSDARDDAIVSETQMRSRPGRGDIDYGSSWRDKFGTTNHFDVSLLKTTDSWTIDAGAFLSKATNRYRSLEHGMMKGASFDYDVPGNISFANFGDARGNIVKGPPEITVTDADGNVDPHKGVGDISGYELQEVDIQPEDGEDEFTGFHANAKYNFELGDNQAYLKFGGRYQNQDRFGDESRFRTEYWGPDGEDGTGDEVISAITPDLIDGVYYAQDGFHIGGSDGVDIQWPNNEAIADLYLAHPEYFFEDGRADDNIISEANDIFTIEEDITAFYIMGNIQFNDGRVSLTGGLRYEETDVTANGAFFDFGAGYQKNSDGSLMVDDDGEFIPIIDDDIETLRLQWLSNRITNNATYDDIYPSAGVKIDITEKLLLRLGYAKTIGRPNFADIIPRTVIEIDEPDPDSEVPVDEQELRGEVTINNTGLNPYEADNFDISLEYYPESGGQIMVGLFKKDITNWITNSDSFVTQDIINEKGLPDDTLGFDYTTTINAGSADVEGLELSLYRPLDFDGLPDWVHDFSVLANGTFLTTEGDFGNVGIAEPITDLEDMVKNTVNFGLTYDNKKFKVQLKYNKRGRELRSRPGGDLQRLFYNAPLAQWDLGVEYALKPNMRLFASGRNLSIESHDRIHRSLDPGLGILSLERSEEFGVQWAVGIKGSL